MHRLVALLAAVTLVSCGSGVPSRAPDIAGAVTKVQGDVVLIEERPSDVSGSAKAAVTVTSATRFLRPDGTQLTAADVRVGAIVRAWSRGPIRESYPVQAEAEAVELVSGDGALSSQDRVLARLTG